MTGLTFAVADLHGRLDLLEDALVAIEVWSPTGGTIVFLGDYIDRGPMSAQVLARLIEGPAKGWQWICLKGNHEDMMSLALRDPDNLDWWIGNGGEATLASYGEDPDAMLAHLPWIEARSMMHVDAHRIYVHAGVDPGLPLDEQEGRTLMWKRYPEDVDEGYGARHVVHGHDPNPGGPLRLAHRTDLDTYGWRTGRLAVGVFDDAVAGGPIDLIEVQRDLTARIGSPLTSLRLRAKGVEGSPR